MMYQVEEQSESFVQMKKTNKQYSNCLSSEEVCLAAAAKLSDIRQKKRQSMKLSVIKDKSKNNTQNISPLLQCDDTSGVLSFCSNESKIQLSLNHSNNVSSFPSPPPPSPVPPSPGTIIASDGEEPIPIESSQSIAALSSLPSPPKKQPSSPCDYKGRRIPGVFLVTPDGTSKCVLPQPNQISPSVLKTASEMNTHTENNKQVGFILPPHKSSTNNKYQPYQIRSNPNHVYRPPSPEGSPCLPLSPHVRAVKILSGLSPVPSLATLTFPVLNPILNYTQPCSEAIIPEIHYVSNSNITHPNHPVTTCKETQQISNSPVAVINKLLVNNEENEQRFDQISSSYLCVSILLILVCFLVSPLAAILCGLPALCCSCISCYYTSTKDYPASRQHARIALLCNIAMIISGIVLLVLVNVPLAVVLMLILR